MASKLPKSSSNSAADDKLASLMAAIKSGDTEMSKCLAESLALQNSQTRSASINSAGDAAISLPSLNSTFL